MQDVSLIALSAAEFEQLFKKYRFEFVVVARSYVRDNMIAEDIVADCFAYFWENRSKIEITRSIPAYILASIKHRCLNWLRDERNRLKIQQALHSQSLRVISERIASLEASEPDAVIEGEIASIVERRLGAMSERMRDVFTAGRLEDMTYKQIAERYDLSVNQVDFEMRKATNSLAKALKDYLPS